jgi:hypothetical protein
MSGRALTKWKRNGARAQTLDPNLKANLKTAGAKPDRPPVAAEIPNVPPQIPEPHNTDA